MIRLMGAFFLMIGAASLGFGAATQLRVRVSTLRALVEALEQMERELSFRLTPMPELMGRLAREAPEPANFLFAYCQEHLYQLGSKSFGELWREAVEKEPELLLSDRERQILTALGEVLGRYDAGDQKAALNNTVQELGRCLLRAEEEHQRLGRVYATLGMGSGAILVILLL